MALPIDERQSIYSAEDFHFQRDAFGSILCTVKSENEDGDETTQTFTMRRRSAIAVMAQLANAINQSLEERP